MSYLGAFLGFMVSGTGGHLLVLQAPFVMWTLGEHHGSWVKSTRNFRGNGWRKETKGRHSKTVWQRKWWLDPSMFVWQRSFYFWTLEYYFIQRLHLDQIWFLDTLPCLCGRVGNLHLLCHFIQPFCLRHCVNKHLHL